MVQPHIAPVYQRLAAAAPRSAQLSDAAGRVSPGGASHDARQINPHGLFVKEASGARKTDVDGNIYVDLVCGHGALLFGHDHRPAIEAAQHALSAGIHFGAGSERELEWAQMVQQLVPCAEMVRFTSSGNEACLLAAALSCAITARSDILTLQGHYLGWALPALVERLRYTNDGVLPERRTAPRIIEAPDTDACRRALATKRIAALMVETTGASFGKVPLAEGALRSVAAAAAAAGTLLVFDETITGFRVSPSGAQGMLGLTPDLAVFGKILGGGLPCGALAGRADLMAALDNTPGKNHAGPRLSHMGTGNGNFVAASAGVATLHAIADGRACIQAEAAAAELRARLNHLFGRKHVSWSAYGAFSGLHLFLDPHGRHSSGERFDPTTTPPGELLTRDRDLVNALRVALLGAGVDINPWPGGLLSTAHSDDDIAAIVDGFSAAIDSLAASGFRLTGWG